MSAGPVAGAADRPPREPRGFIYVVPTVTHGYVQPTFSAVPTWHVDRIYFGPCKRPMRPRMLPGDVVCGISPSSTRPRRIVFIARIGERMTFAEAYAHHPELRGPPGPIHVRPAARPGPWFPDSEYEHIPGANHADNWRADLRTPDLDAFFACDRASGPLGAWLGASGPTLAEPLMEFLRTCSVWGNAGKLRDDNPSATVNIPVRHGGLFTGLHLETDRPDQLIRLVCGASIDPKPPSQRNGRARAASRCQ